MTDLTDYKTISFSGDGEIEMEGGLHHRHSLGFSDQDVGQDVTVPTTSSTFEVSGKEKEGKSKTFLYFLGFSKESFAISAKENNAPKDMSYFALFKLFLWFGSRAFGGVLKSSSKCVYMF